MCGNLSLAIQGIKTYQLQEHTTEQQCLELVLWTIGAFIHITWHATHLVLTKYVRFSAVLQAVALNG